jgi:hypothetical protein
LDEIVLTGSATAINSGNITFVATELGQCVGVPTCTQLGDSLFGSVNTLFTTRALDHAVPVAAGQIVQVTVTLSFS